MLQYVTSDKVVFFRLSDPLKLDLFLLHGKSLFPRDFCRLQLNHLESITAALEGDKTMSPSHQGLVPHPPQAYT